MFNLKNSGKITHGNFQLIFAIICITVILIGISGKINLGFANIGRLILFLIGILLVATFIEMNHNLTLIIDSKILSEPGMITKQTENFRQISLIMLGFGVVMFLMAFYFIGQRKYAFFTSFASISLWTFGTLIGRTINGVSINTKGSMEWKFMKDEEKISYYSQLKAWLDGSSNNTISSIQQDKIINQRVIFDDIIRKQTKLPKRFKDTINSLDESEDMLEYLYSIELKSGYTDWLDGAERYIEDGNIRNTNMRELIKRMLTINVLDILLQELSMPDWRNTRLFLQILEEKIKSERYLSGHSLVNDTLDNRISLQSKFSSENKLSKLHEDMGNFVRFVSWQALQWEEYRFSSGWLNFLKTQHQIISNSSTYNDVNIEHPLVKHIPKVKENYQEWCYTISEVFSNRRIPDSSIIAESIINEVRRMDTGHFNSDLVSITYWAYDKLV